MLSVKLEQCGKSYNRKWLFRNLDLTLNQGDKWAVLGANGSGKSTFSLMLCGQVWPTEGKMSCSLNNHNLPVEQMYAHCSLASPAMELPGEFTLAEVVAFHQKSKPLTGNSGLSDIAEFCGFDKKTVNKPLITYSSGMLQRVKLALAAFSDTEVLLLDEPLSNLDKEGFKLFDNIMTGFCENRLLVIASNREDEYQHCNKFLQINSDGSVALNE